MGCKFTRSAETLCLLELPQIHFLSVYFFSGAIEPRHRVRVGHRRPFILMSLPPTTGDHLDTMFPTSTDLAPRIDGQYFGETVNATIATLGHTDALVNEYLAFADTVFYATADSPRPPPQYNGVYGGGIDSTKYAYRFAFSNHYPLLAPVPVPALLPTSACVTEFAPSPVVKFAVCGCNDAELSAWYSPSCNKWSDQLTECPSFAYLTGVYRGDYGWGTADLGIDPTTFDRYRKAELIHACWAMLGVLGCSTPKIPAKYSGFEPNKLVWSEAGDQFSQIFQ